MNTQMNTNNVIKIKEATVGAGKTYNTLQDLAKDGFEGTILFASLTKKLSVQSFEDYKKLCAEHGNLPKARLIDSDTYSPVSRELKRSIGENNILFITHSAYLESVRDLKDVTVIIDEVPAETIQYVNVIFDDSSAPALFNQWLEKSRCTIRKSDVFLVSLKEDYVGKAEELIRNIRAKRNTVYSNQVAVVLESLLDKSVDVMYYTAATNDGTVYHKYQSIESRLLSHVVSSLENGHDITILGANILESSFSYVASALYGVEFKEVGNLRKTHNCKIEIYPYLKSGNWSRSLMDSMANEKLEGEPMSITVKDHIQWYARSILGTEDMFITKNEDDSVIKDFSKLPATTTHVHGINDYKELHKMMYMASTRPSPDELKTVAYFCEDNDLNNIELRDRLVQERCYEACRQAVGRLSIRKQEAETDNIVRKVVVPDMRYAEYLSRSFLNATIMEGGYDIIKVERTYSEEKATERQDTRLETVTAILVAKAAQKSLPKAERKSMPALVKSYGITEPTFSRYKKEFLPELKAAGLVK